MGASRRFVQGLMALLRPARDRRELDDELRQFFDAAVEHHLARGLSRAEAQRAASFEVGSRETIKDDVRDVGWESWAADLFRDVQHAARSLRAAPGFTAAVVVTLGLGIGLNTAIFSMVDAVMLQRLPVPSPDELIALHETAPRAKPDTVGGSGRYLLFSHPRFLRLRQALRPHGELAALTSTTLMSARVNTSDQPLLIGAQLVSGNYFEMLHVPAARGRTLDDADIDRAPGTSVAVISDGLWKRVLGGSDGVLGTTLELNGVRVNVIGVAAPGFSGTWMDEPADVWVPFTLQPALQYRSNYSATGPIARGEPFLNRERVAWLVLVGRVKPSERRAAESVLQTANLVGNADLSAALTAIEETDFTKDRKLVIEEFARGFSRLRARQSDLLVSLMALVGLILLLTSANVANLLLVRASGRARELAVRIALGASMGRIVRYLLTETLLLAALGGAIGVLAAAWCRSALARQIIGSSEVLPTGFSLDPRMLMFAAVASVVAAVLFGVLPALRAGRIGRASAVGRLNERVVISGYGMGGMRPLVMLQLALSVVIVFGALLLSHTLLNLTRIDPGFDTAHLVDIAFNGRAAAAVASSSASTGRPGDGSPPLDAQINRLVSSLAAIPSVRSAAASTCGLLAGCSYVTSIDIKGFDNSIRVLQNWITPGYFATIGLPIVRGREFGPQDTGQSAPVVIVSESIAKKYFPDQDAIGKHIKPNGAVEFDTAEIVGIVRDLRPVSLREPPALMIFYPMTRRRADAVPGSIVVRASGDPDQLAAVLRDRLTQEAPGLPTRILSMPALLSQQIERERMVAYMSSAFAVLALLLASVGLYGVLSYVVTQRRREIGIRIALGAQHTEVVGMVMRQGLLLAITGFSIGLIVAPMAMKSLTALFFDVTPLDPAAFVGVTLVMLPVAAAAALIPARRASRVDPLVALRHEG